MRLLDAVVLTLALAACGSNGKADPPSDASCADCGVIDSGAAGTDAMTARCEGTLPVQWNTGGANCPEPDFQTVRYDSGTFILRQSLCTSGEAPFLHLWIGPERALLEDTGDGGVDVVAAVDAALNQWVTETGNAEPPLLVVNSHGHGDHTRGNTAFSARANTVVVGSTIGDIESFFGIDYPSEDALIDLGGGRVVRLLGIPGHQSAHIALHDPSTGLLLTGDSLYPGRLFISDFADYRSSIDRLVAFTAGLEICHVLGTHIELSNQPGDEFPIGSQSHPDERPLELTRAHLVELSAALAAMANAPRRETHDDFVIVP